MAAERPDDDGPACATEVETQPRAVPRASGPWRVLVAEDVPSQQKLLVTVLKKAGHAVTAASDGREAWGLYCSQPFDIALMDGQMPGMDGLDATRAIREHESRAGGHLPIVAVTAHALVNDEEKCRNAGVDAYLRKPLNLVEMMSVLKTIVAENAV